MVEQLKLVDELVDKGRGFGIFKIYDSQVRANIYIIMVGKELKFHGYTFFIKE